MRRRVCRMREVEEGGRRELGGTALGGDGAGVEGVGRTRAGWS